MSVGDLRAYYFRMIGRFMDQSGVPKAGRKKLIDEIHEGIKSAYNEEFGDDLPIDSISKESGISRTDLHTYISRSEAILIRDFAYIVDDNEELKF